MITLRMLGGLSLDGLAALPERVSQRRRLAVLALLASAPGRTMSRDRLMLLVWPDADTQSARHRLSSVLYDLRKALGTDGLVTRGEDIWLDPERVRTDVAELEVALAARDWERVAALYQGPFLDGFHLSDSVDFANWVDGWRDRLARDFANAMLVGAEERLNAGDSTAAAALLRRSAVADPYNARVALRLMEALVAAGDRTGALRQAAVHGALRRRELDAEPDADIAQLVAELSAEPVLPVLTPPPVPDAATHAPLRVNARGSTVGRVRASRWLLAAVLPVAVVIALKLSRNTLSAAESVPVRIAVFPFEVRGSSEQQYLAEGMVDLLSTNLDGAGELRAVDPYALLMQVGTSTGVATRATRARAISQRLDASHYVLGSVFAEDGRLRIVAALYSRNAALAQARATVDGSPQNILELVDQLTTRLLAASFSAPTERVRSVAARTTSSLPALKAYLQGERDFRAGRFVSAIEGLEQATTLDSTFALAHYRLSLATVWADQNGASAELSDQRALRHGARLSSRDRMLVEAHIAWRKGDAVAAERLYRQVVALHPDEVEAWQQLGETLFHYNPQRGRAVREARAAFAAVIGHDSAHWGALWHAAQIAALERQWPRLDSLAARMLALQPDPEREADVHALQTFARGDSAAVARLIDGQRGAESLRLFTMGWRAAVFAGNINAAAEVFRLLTQGHRADWEKQLGRIALGHVHLAHGQLHRADDAMRSGAAPAEAMQARAILAAYGVVPGHEATLDSLRNALAHWSATAHQAGHPNARSHRRISGLYLAGLLSIANSDSAFALARARALDMQPQTQLESPRFFAAALRAHVARHAGRAQDALRMLEAASDYNIWFGNLVSAPATGRQHERYARAELLFELGRYEEAIGWYASFGEHTIYDLAYLPLAHYRRAEIYEKLGKPAQASAHYRAFIDFWRHCDPELRPRVQEAERRITRLETFVSP
ncbi:MAG: BTAD domain-containing putative transcriptional regulator [Longimicrobiales bacterium]